jgi:hypothetical protein
MLKRVKTLIDNRGWQETKTPYTLLLRGPICHEAGPLLISSCQPRWDVAGDIRWDKP